MSDNSPTDQPPLLRIVKGSPSTAELAALTAVLAALSRRTTAPKPTTPVGGWADPARRLRRPLPAGPGAWRASAWA